MIAGPNRLSNHNIYVDWCIRSHCTLTIHSYWVCVRSKQSCTILSKVCTQLYGCLVRFCY